MFTELSEDDESGLVTPKLLRKESQRKSFSNGKNNFESNFPFHTKCKKLILHFYKESGSSRRSTVIIEPLSNEVLSVWSQLPEAIRLNPSLAAVPTEDSRMLQIQS